MAQSNTRYFHWGRRVSTVSDGINGLAKNQMILSDAGSTPAFSIQRFICFNCLWSKRELMVEFQTTVRGCSSTEE